MNQHELGAEIEMLLNRSKQSLIIREDKSRFQSKVESFTLIMFVIFIIALMGFAAGNQNRYPDGTKAEPVSSIEAVYAQSGVVQSPAIQSTELPPQSETEPSGEAEEHTWIRESRGMASTYGWGEKLNPHTSCGQDFDADVIAVAVPAVLTDKSLCGRMAEITYNGTTIQAEIWDGGPHPRLNRIVDLTKGAAIALGINNPTVFSVDLKY